MAKTSIEWTEVTWNPVRGCSRVSEGCRNCYAERMSARFSRGSGDPFYGFALMTPSGPRWTGKVELIEEKLSEPLRWRKPRRVFVNSMSDLFHENLQDEAIDRIFAVMALCPHLTFQVLTKRSGRMREYWTGVDLQYRLGLIFRAALALGKLPGRLIAERMDTPFPLPNVWLGVSVEDRAHLSRIDDLRETPAAVRFLSLEPLLEDLGELDMRGIDWVIAGGESGPGARPMHPDWVRSIRDQCTAAGVPFFFKQWGHWQPITFDDRHGKCVLDEMKDIWVYPDGKWTRQYQAVAQEWAWPMWPAGKKAAGRLLDGRIWDEFPGAR